MGLGFEWDEAKAALNLRKHGVAFAEALTIFVDPLAVIISDPVHSEGEVRFLLLGLSKAGRLLVVSHVDRGERTRIISAREATRQERWEYEHG